tara:strand:- start:457 stop:663 length:207 start_codon:yes stop_codon:yes gene_type:complete
MVISTKNIVAVFSFLFVVILFGSERKHTVVSEPGVAPSMRAAHFEQVPAKIQRGDDEKQFDWQNTPRP